MLRLSRFDPNRPNRDFKARNDVPEMFTLNALPNWMTIMRIVIAPLIAVLIWIDEPAYGYQVALALYTIASVTDYIDGYMARRLKVESPLGEMLDPIADKLLVAAVLLALASVTSSGWVFFSTSANHPDP